jgi:hypothetical protein
MVSAIVVSPIGAQSPEPGLQLAIPDCEDLSGEQIAGIVRLEVAAQRKPEGDSPRDTRASLRCEALRAAITVEDASGSAPLLLELDLAHTNPEARARVVALAIAELIATRRLERNEAAPPPPEEPPAASPGDSAFELSLEVGAARAYDPALFAPFIGIGAAQHVSQFALFADLALALGWLDTDQAALSTREMTLSLAPAWTPTVGALELGLAVGARAGYVSLSASPRIAGLAGRDLSGWVFMPLLRILLALRVSPQLAVRVAVESDYVATPIRGLDPDQGSLLSLRGLRLAAAIGVIWRPWTTGDPD